MNVEEILKNLKEWPYRPMRNFLGKEEALYIRICKNTSFVLPIYSNDDDMLVQDERNCPKFLKEEWLTHTEH